MKKLIAILMTIAMLVCFAACTNTEETTTDGAEEATSEEITDLATDISEESTDEAADVSEESTDEAVVEDSAVVSVLSAVWDKFLADEALIASFDATSSEEIAGYFAGGDSFAMGTPAVYANTDADALNSIFAIPAENAESIAEIASVMHAMNGNNLTAAAIVLAEGTDVDAFVESMKNAIAAREWLCGMPEKYVAAILDGVVFSVFGNADMMNAFVSALNATEGAEILVEDAIA